MKKRKTYIYSGIILLFAMLAFSCSKEDSSTATPDKQKSAPTAMDKTFANGIHGNEFVTSQLNSVMTHYNGMPHFANNTGNNNFTGSGPGSSGGNGNSGTGSFTVFNTSYTISIGGYDTWGDGWFSIYLINLDDLDAANAIVFDVLSPSENEIASGTYSFSNASTPYTFYWAQVILGLEGYYEFSSGTISISQSGDSYSINIEGTLENGESITGWYTGNLMELGGEPEPPNNGTMTATLDSQLWIAENVFANLDSQNGILDITGNRTDGTTLSMQLNAEMISPGVQLSISNDGVYYMYISTLNGYYYTDSFAVVNITTYISSTISGTFEFNGKDYNNNPLLVTNGVFNNVPIY